MRIEADAEADVRKEGDCLATVEAKAEICEIEAAVRKEGDCLASCRG